MINVAVRLLIFLKPIEYIDAATIPDDSYLSLTIAKNIANGAGPLYSENFTNGFQPLYVMLMVPVFSLLSHDLITPVYISLSILIIFDTLSLYLILKIVSLFSKNILTTIAVAVSWIINPYVIKTSLNGLETMLSFFFIVLITYYFLKNQLWLSKNLSNKNLGILGILFGLAVLARIDNLLLVAAIYTFTFIKILLAEKQYQKYFRFLSITLLSCAVILLPWLIYSWYYTGSIYPESGKAVRFISLSNVNHDPTFSNWYLIMMQKSLISILRNNITYVILILILAAIIFVGGISNLKRYLRNKLEPFNPVLLFSVFLFLSYSFYIFTYWFFDRYLFPFELLFILYFAVLLDFVMSKINDKKFRSLFFISVLLVIVCTNVMRTGFRELFFLQNSGNSGYMKIGLWARDNFNDGTVIGSTQSGALGYFADNLRVINLDGVVNKECFEAMSKQDLFNYVKRSDIKYVIGWQNSIDFICRESRDMDFDELIYWKDITDIRTLGYEWYVYEIVN